MKFNWGTGIAIFYGTFMVIMIVFVIKSRSVDHSLVMDNYYEEDMNYQAHKDKLANSKSLATDLEISRDANKVVKFQFPNLNSTVTGEVWFYKPNDNSKDFKIQVKPDENGMFLVNGSELTSGLWRLKVEWQAAGREFFKEHQMVL